MAKPKSSQWLEGLNKEQKRAVQTIDGPLLVLAGAGSGKTRVITHRIAHMMACGIAPEQILGVTFTNKAAAEMQERLSKMVGAAASKVTLSTFHALGLRILRTEAGRRKQNRRLVIFDGGDQMACLREITARLKLDRSLDLGSILTRISAMKNDFVDPERVEADPEDPYQEAAAIYYPAYQEQLEAYSAVDFDDLVCKPCQLMANSTAMRKRWSERFRYVLVDEYQDTNGSQLKLLRALAAEHGNLCVVGDDDQSIYGWRGAQVENILRFAKDFPGAKTVHLANNYRSVAAVLQLANRVIAENPKRHEKKMVPVREQGELPQMMIFSDGDAEASWIASHIRESIGKGTPAKGIAVLYRSNLFSRELETALRAEGIHYRVLGGTSFFESKEIKDLLAYLRICAHPSDEISLRRVINVPPRGIGPRTVNTLASWSEKTGASFQTALQQAESILGDGNRQAAAVANFLALLDRVRPKLKQGRELHLGVRALVDELQLEQSLQQSSKNVKVVDKRLARLRSLIQGVRSYCERSAKPSLHDLLSTLALNSNEDDLEELGAEQVTLSSLHGAKGLEFRLVVLAGMEEGYLPHDRTINPHQNDIDVGDIAEERRLLYVGITRAMDRLVLTRAQERQVRGKLQPRTPTRFLDKIKEDMLRTEDTCRPVTNEEVQHSVAAFLASLES